jgi:ABC-type dipeptide/oligopeptide/nickel transport system permease subunit
MLTTSSKLRAVGVGSVRIVLRHLPPNLAPILIVITTLSFGSAVLFTATLSFLDLGAQHAGREYVRYG